MSELKYWQNSLEAREIRDILQKEIQGHKENLENPGRIFMDTNEEIVKKYAHTLGVIQGLQTIEQLLTQSEEEDGQDY